MTSVEIRPFLPIVQLLLLIAVVLGAAFWLHRLEGNRSPLAKILFGVRTVAIVAIALLLLNPVQVKTFGRPNGKSPLLVLLDKSHSMSVPDVQGVRRFDAARKALLNPDFLKSLSNHNTTFFDFAANSAQQTPESLRDHAVPDGTKTHIGESISDALSSAGDAPQGAILLVSDGRDHGEIAATEIARQSKTRGFAVYTVCLGSPTKTKDVAIAMTRPQIYTSIDQEVSIAADISTTGYENATDTVRFFREGKQIAEKTVTLRSGDHTEVTFPTKESSKGTYRYSIEVTPLPGEVTVVNNRSATLLTVGNATTQILVLEGRPSWDTKFMIQALHNDPTLAVDSIFQLSPSRTFGVRGVAAEDPSSKDELKVPSTRAGFAKYDIVILGKGAEEIISPAAAKELQEYVARDAGHLIFLRGQADPNSKTLAEMEPITWSQDEIDDLRLKVTAEGAANPAFQFSKGQNPSLVVEKLPTLISATKVKEEKALTVVLARASGTNNTGQPNREMAAVAYQRYGSGLVLSLVGEGLWRWALLPPNLVDYTNCYNDFWTQTARWMVNQSDFLPGQNFSLRTDDVAYSPGETVNLMVFVRGANRTGIPAIQIVQPNGNTVKVSLSKGGGKQADFIGTFRPTSPGDYIANLAEPGDKGSRATAPFSVFERQQEDMNTSPDPALMRQIAEAGGGATLGLNELDRLPQLLKESQVWVKKKPEIQSLWDRWQVLLLILTLLAIEWFVRRKAGLV